MAEKKLSPIRKEPGDLRASLGAANAQPQPAPVSSQKKIRSSEVVIITIVIILCLCCCLTCIGGFVLIRNIPAIWEWLTETGLEIKSLMI